MKYSHRFFLYAPVATVVLLAAAVSAYWFVTAHAFSKRLDALNGHPVAPGVKFHYRSKSIGGFPFRVDAVLEDLRVDVATAHGPASWRAEHFALHMLDYGRLRLVFEAAGKQVLTWHDRKGLKHGFEFVPALLRASATVGGERLTRFDLELYGASTPAFSVAHSELHMRRDPNADALDIAFMADDMHLMPALQTTLGDMISRARLKATLAPAEEWDALLSGRSGWRKAAEAWREHSGAFDIVQLDIAWGKTEASGSGLLTLDRARRPQGLIKLRIAGYQALAKEAERRHLVQGAQEGVLAALMAETAAAGGDRAGRLPVTLAFKDGLIYVGETPAGFLSPLY
jgi:hypothetical protein